MTATHCLPNSSLVYGEIGTPRLSPDLFRMDDSTLLVNGNPKRRGRIIMNPGIGGSTLVNPFWEPNTAGGTLPPISVTSLRPQLNALGFQTVQVPNIPQMRNSEWDLVLDPLLDTGHGSRFLNRNMLFFDHIMEWCWLKYGGKMPTFVVGMSWGAWSSCQQAVNRGSGVHGINGAYAHCPVNDFSKISSFAAIFDQLTSSYYTGMSLSTTALNAVDIPMRVTWAVDDNFITGGNGSTDPPVDAIAMVANACTALGGTNQAGSHAVVSPSIGVNMNSDANFLGGTGVLALASSAGLPVASPTQDATHPGPQTVYITNCSSFFGTIGTSITYTGISGNTLTGCLFGPNTIGATLQSSSVASGAKSDGVWAGPGLGTGMVTGQGMSENHVWDTGGTGHADTDDCVNWFTNVICPVYPVSF
jgi:hypothetical protein